MNFLHKIFSISSAWGSHQHKEAVLTKPVRKAKTTKTHLFDGNGYSDRVHWAFDQNLLFFVPADCHRSQEQFFAAPELASEQVGWQLRRACPAKYSAHLTSTSGLLCRSTTCDSKFSKHMVAVSVERTADRYGFKVAA